VCDLKKNGINRAAIIKKKKKNPVSINQLNREAPEKAHATDELVGYNL